ncbi:MAG: DUF4349 domain-containing protein [Chloroflexi bacterium]|nr:DUF4349 domain-containing protein [Chloroflexota bacterium]
MKRLLPYSFLLIAAIVLGACGIGGARSSEYPAEAPVMMEPDYYVAPAPTMMANATDGIAQESSAPGSGGGGDVSATQVERLVIQNADLSVVVSDVELRMDEISQMAVDMGGFVVSSQLYQDYTSDYLPVPGASLTIRVPAERLDEALDKIKKDAVEVQSENRSGTDVTAEYVDLKSRLKTYEAAEKELTELMENSQNAEEVVNIFNQLMYYREQIELVKGQIKYYEEAAALSAISVRLIAEETIKPVTIGKWEPKGVALEAVQDLLDFWKGFVDFMIRFVIYTLPVLVTVGIPLYLAFLGLRWVFRKMRGNKKKVEPQVKEEEKK